MSLQNWIIVGPWEGHQDAIRRSHVSKIYDSGGIGAYGTV